MRFATILLASLLLCVAGWGQAVRRGYEAGKRDATASLSPHAVVVIDRTGACALYESGQQVHFVEPARAQVAVLIQPVW